jgi:hypothetical protein
MTWMEWLLAAVSVGCCVYWYFHSSKKAALVYAAYCGLWVLWFHMVRIMAEALG